MPIPGSPRWCAQRRPRPFDLEGRDSIIFSRWALCRAKFRPRAARMRVLVAIPVFNESRSLLRVIAAVREHVSDVLIVDDGSTDSTPRLLAEIPDLAVIRHPDNRGYGQSLIDAFAYSAAHRYD